MKINGWTKVYRKQNETAWQNDFDLNQIFLYVTKIAPTEEAKRAGFKHTWRTYLINLLNEKTWISDTSNRVSAEKNAVDYMLKHKNK